MWIKDIYHDEIRSGFLVTTDRKKVWEKEMEILAEFNRICKKHGLRYFADSGTLLGAVRHQGFIPWDDDIDVAMLRPDYEKFKKIAVAELTPPYELQTPHNSEVILPLIKVRDGRTTAVEHPDLRQMNQGIFIDIFPLDAVWDGTPRGNRIADIAADLWRTIVYKGGTDLSEWRGCAMDLGMVKKLLGLPILEPLEIYETFQLEHFADARKISFFTSCANGTWGACEKAWYADIIELPFESFSIPVPAEYAQVLTEDFGDWHKFVRGTTLHEGIVFSADIPYQEYLDVMENPDNGRDAEDDAACHAMSLTDGVTSSDESSV